MKALLCRHLQLALQLAILAAGWSVPLAVFGQQNNPRDPETRQPGLQTTERTTVPNSVDEEFSRMDANKDGKLSAAEHAKGSKDLFQIVDANGDGKITVAEMDRVQPEAPAGAPNSLSSSEKIKALDTDGDGQLTALEHASGTRELFTQMDVNSDSALSIEELRAGHSQFSTGR
jgi:Ca2+-binding EF-hand superfamily protein